MCECVAGSVRHAASVEGVISTDGGTHSSSRNTGEVRMCHCLLFAAQRMLKPLIKYARKYLDTLRYPGF